MRKLARNFAVDSKKLMIAMTLIMIGVFYSLFMLVPIIYAFIGSFCDWNPMIGKMDFTGLDNYIQVFDSPIFWKAIINTLIFTAVVTFMRAAIGLILAVWIDELVFLKGFLRSVYFIPVVTSLVAVSLVWVWIYEPTSGILNMGLKAIGLPALGWLKDQYMALPAIMIMTIWKDTGFAMVLYLAGLNNISKSLYEAADVDGASRFQKFAHIKLPMLSTTTVLIVVTGIITYIQMFDQVFMMTEKAGPNNATMTAVYMVYDQAFINFKFGTASVVTFIIFILTLIFSLMQLRLQRNPKEGR